MPHRSTLVHAGFATGAALLLSWLAPSARADTTVSRPSAQRPSAAEGAADACRHGRWAAAVELMRVVERRQRRPEDWLCLARAQFHTGQWVAALDSYDELAESESPARAVRRVGAVERRRLEQRLGWVQIVTSTPLPASVRLNLDGETISPSLVGVAFPVQPGTHVFSVAVEAQVRELGHWRIAQGEHRTIGVSLPAQPLPAPSSSERAVVPDGAAPRQPKQKQSVSGFQAEPSELERWAKGTVVAGGLAIVGGVGLLWLSAGAHSRGLLYAGLGSGALGGAGLLTGAGLYVANEFGESAPMEAAPEPARRLQVQPWILSDGVGTGISGSF